MAGIAAALCLAAAGLCATAARYLEGVDPSRLPEAPGLCRGARVIAWILVLAALSCGLAWAGLQAIVRHTALCRPRHCRGRVLWPLSRAPAPGRHAPCVSPRPRGPLRPWCADESPGERPGQRRGAARYRSALHLGAHRRPPQSGAARHRPVSSGLALHVPDGGGGATSRVSSSVWACRSAGSRSSRGFICIGRGPWIGCFAFPCSACRRLTVGHEGEEEGARRTCSGRVEHAANEYTLLLGNGRDLITVDAAVQFRIADARAWRYHCQNPADALQAIAYRAVMRTTVNRTLSEALSENVADLDGAHARHGAAGCRRPRPRRRSHGLHGRRHASAGARGFRLPGRGLRGARKGDRGRQCPGLPQSDRAAGRRLRSWSARTPPARKAPKRSPRRRARPGAFARWSRSIAPRPRNTSSAAVWRRSRRASRGVAFTVVDSRFQRDGGELWLMP